jgi:hypothetical protein
MPRNRVQIQKPPQREDSLSFPVPYREQAKYLKLADDFLALDQPPNSDKVFPTDWGRHAPGWQRKKVA